MKKVTITTVQPANPRHATQTQLKMGRKIVARIYDFGEIAPVLPDCHAAVMLPFRCNKSLHQTESVETGKAFAKHKITEHFGECEFIEK